MPESASAATDLDLISYLNAIPDARMRRGVRIPAWYLLLVAVLGILSRCQSLRDLERFAIRHHGVLTEALGLELRRPPSDSACASSMPLCGCSPISTSRRPSGFRLRRATAERGAARAGGTTNRSPRRIGYCVGVASAEKTANALRRFSSNAIRWTCWRRFGAARLLW